MCIVRWEGIMRVLVGYLSMCREGLDEEKIVYVSCLLFLQRS